ncbi:MAG: hypothetical protein M3409_10775 [Gemmatimonadota bacterium]|jgi:hypothetical protein|nr:hypothetical protein [Gemmatimonadota bacterium]
MSSARVFRSLALLLPLLGACVPYTVGSTAQTVPRGTISSAASLSFIPGGLDPYADEEWESESATFAMFDFEGRFGLDARSDIGVRIPTLSGIVVNYKRRLDGDTTGTRSALAAMVGGGFVNMGEHAHFEASLIASGPERSTLTPYGGLRAMQVLPLSSSAASDSPTLGIFGGLRIGTRELGVSPELGIFYDRSTLGLRSNSIIFVPAVTVHGEGLRRVLWF